MRWSWAVSLLVAAALPNFAAHADSDINTNAPKVMLRTSGGLFSNAGTTATSYGGFNLGIMFFVTPELSIGAGYKADFDVVHGTAPFKGYDFSGRWYFLSAGTVVTRKSGDNVFEFHSRVSPYLGVDFSQRDFLLSSSGQPVSGDTSNATGLLQGSFLALNANLGLDAAINRHFEYTVELSTTAFSFASSDANVRVQQYLVNTGFNFVW